MLLVMLNVDRCAKGELGLELREKFELKMKLQIAQPIGATFRRWLLPPHATPPNAPLKAKWAVVRALFFLALASSLTLLCFQTWLFTLG